VANTRDLHCRPSTTQFNHPRWDDYASPHRQGKLLLLAAGVVHDVAEFIDEHPSGPILLLGMAGKNATASFQGGVYNHSRAARNLLAKMSVADLSGGSEVEIRKITQKSLRANNVLM